MKPTWTHLLLYDGVCNLCDGGVQFILRHDALGKMQFCSIQSEMGQQLYRSHGHNPEAPDTMLLLTPEGAFTQSDAMLHIAHILGGMWRVAGVLRLIPRPVRDWFYRFIAEHRYRWFGRSEVCLLPRPEWQSRFLG